MSADRLLRPALLALVALATAGCEWFTDFKRQPYVTTWESLRADSLVVRGSPQGSVPTTGTAVPGFAVSYANLPATIDSMSGLQNPVPISAASLENGRRYYQLNCTVCHGDQGNGIGAIVRFGFPPIPINGPAAANRSDGYIFGMIRNGRNMMPSYNRIEERDRWDVVNYVRALQGRAGTVPFEVGPIAMPGVNGDRVPGATRLGPNQWVPHVLPSGAVRGPAAGQTAPVDTARTGTPGRTGGDA